MRSLSKVNDCLVAVVAASLLVLPACTIESQQPDKGDPTTEGAASNVGGEIADGSERDPAPAKDVPAKDLKEDPDQGAGVTGGSVVGTDTTERDPAKYYCTCYQKDGDANLTMNNGSRKPTGAQKTCMTSCTKGNVVDPSQCKPIPNQGGVGLSRTECTE